MSSIFSDPGWRRGGTLLNGELVEFSDAPTNTVPSAGTELVGQVKVFQDINPSTGQRYSNRLVYCVAARYTGSTLLDRDSLSTYAGRFVVLDDGLGTFNAIDGDSSAVDAGKCVGVVDEYLSVDVRQHDIVWVVVKGPVNCRTANGSSLAAGVACTLGTSGLLSGSAVTDISAAPQVGLTLETAGLLGGQATGDDTQRVNLLSQHV
jgi:hypothetical protein